MLSIHNLKAGLSLDVAKSCHAADHSFSYSSTASIQISIVICRTVIKCGLEREQLFSI